MTETTSPADEMIKAGLRLRALLASDSLRPGPWRVTPRYRKGMKVIAQYDLFKNVREGSGSVFCKSVNPNAVDTLYGAVVHPGVGEQLAALLIETGQSLTVNTHPGWQETVASRLVSIARQINDVTDAIPGLTGAEEAE